MLRVLEQQRCTLPAYAGLALTCSPLSHPTCLPACPPASVKLHTPPATVACRHHTPPTLCSALGDLSPGEQALLKAVFFLRHKGQTRDYIQHMLERPPPQWQVMAGCLADWLAWQTAWGKLA